MNYRDYLEHRGVDTFDGAGSSDFLINCPFHDDNHPSLEVHRRTGVYYCFGCKASGKFPALVAEIENITLLEAKKQLMKVDTTESVVSDISDMLDTFEDDVEEPKYYSVDSFHSKFSPLRLNPDGLKYIINRKINKDNIDWFDLRWGGSEGKWRDRVIIPIFTETGKLLTYAGRTIVPKVMPKTRKIKGRSPRSTLYGLHELIKYYGDIRFPSLIVVEGEFDAEYLQTFGLPAVATMGTMGLTGAQIYLLKKYAQTVVFSYDGDDAGEKAQARGISKVKGYVPTIGIKLLKKHDPNELSPEQVESIYRGYFL